MSASAAVASLSAENLAGAARATETDADQRDAEASRLNATAAALAARQRELDDLDRSIADGQARLAELTEQRLAALAEAGAAETRAARRTAVRYSPPGSGTLATWRTRSPSRPASRKH